MVTDLGSGDTTVYASQAHSVYGWTPDGRRFAFLVDPQLPRAQIGELGGEPMPAHGEPGVASIDVRWIDDDRYLCTAIRGQEKTLLLQHVGGPGTEIATLATRALIYDWAR